MASQQISIFWYITLAVMSVLATVAMMHLIAWIQDKRNPPNELEWLDRHMNKEHYFPDPNNKGVTLKGKLIDINPAKGNRAKNKPNYEFVFQVGTKTKYYVLVNQDWRLVR